MTVFQSPEFRGHEQLSFCHDVACGLYAVIAIHKTGPRGAGGGIRMFPYESEAAAVRDALRLSRAMSYKFAIAGIPIGGGKSVIIGDPAKDKSEALLEAFGRAVESFRGRYVCGPDVGTSAEDMVAVRHSTRHVRGLPDDTGDTSPATGFGVYRAIQAAVHQLDGERPLQGLSVAVQGAGNVGQALCRHLHDEGVQIYIADTKEEAAARIVEDFGARAVSPSDILTQDVDVVAPCAMGAVLNDDTVPKLNCRIVCGGANNQLAEPHHGDALHDAGILFVPDYVANAGGAIHATQAGPGFDDKEAMALVGKIYNTCQRVFDRAEKDAVAPYVAADALAEETIAIWG